MKISYGYKLNKSQGIEVHEEQAKTVKLIYDLYLQGKSLGGIVNCLKSSNILSPTGKTLWTRATIDNMLSNKKYVPLIISMEQFIETQFQKESRTNLQSNNMRKTARYNSGNVLTVF
jgi:site-specific DNA recombinase